MDKKDYAVFLNLLKIYLSPLPPQAELSNTHHSLRARIRETYFEVVSLHSFCLMPNHFHLLLHQKTPRGIASFMRALATSYSMYFNNRYKRVGPLFQGRYKGVIVLTDPYLLHLSRYIHLNPREIMRKSGGRLEDYEYSSFSQYMGIKKRSWVITERILSYFISQRPTLSSTSVSFFPSSYSYSEFVKDYSQNSKDLLGELSLD